MPGFLNIENKKASSAGMQCCGYEFVLQDIQQCPWPLPIGCQQYSQVAQIKISRHCQMFHAVEWRGDKLGPHLQVSCGSSPTPLVWINCFLLYFLIIIFLLQKSYLTLCDDIDAPLHALLKLCSSFIQQKHITHLLMFYGCPKNIMVTQIDTVPILMKLSYLK